MKKKIYKKYRKSKLYYPSMKLLMRILQYKKPKDIIVFESNVGKHVGDSPLLIYLAWLEYDENQKFIWVYNKKFPKKYKSKNTKCIKRLSIQYYYYIVRAKLVVNNQNLPYYVLINKRGLYLQTWHGTPIKKMQNDLDNIVGRDSGYLSRVNLAASRWTHLLAQSTYAGECFSSAFKHNAKTLYLGYPRNDLFFNVKNKESIYKKFNLNMDKKIILYAPTFREQGNVIKKKYQQELPFNPHEILDSLSEEYVFLIKGHLIANIINVEFDEQVIDVSNIQDINELILISDVVITDYSSLMFDAIHSDAKILLYPYDLKEYEYKLRGFYLDYKKDLPFKKCYTQDELIKGIEDNTINNYQEFKDKFVSYDDKNASKRIVEYFVSELQKIKLGD